MHNMPDNDAMVTEDEIIDLIKVKTGTEKINSDSDIFNDLGVVGDDFDELLGEYHKKFDVNMDKYLWYFHADEEGQSIGGLFFKSPNKRVTRIPVTPKMLTEFANVKKWDIQYPEHKLPKYRLDIIINQTLIAGLVIWLLTQLVKSYFS